MNNENRRKIEQLAADSIRELGDHAFQDEVISPNIKRVKQYLTEIMTISQSDVEEVYPLVAQRSRLDDVDKANILRIVYAMARFDFPILNTVLKTEFNQTEAFNYLEKLTGTKATTLKNMRDRFDPYIVQERSSRKGWHQVQLMPDYAEVKALYDGYNEDALAKELDKILNSLRKK